MPVGQEMKSAYHLDQKYEQGLLEAVIWRNVGDYLVVEYEEVEMKIFNGKMRWKRKT
jgi:hypothetical protein